MFMITAEILLCQDRIHCNSRGLFTGSPLLLQIWIQKRLRLIYRPNPVDNCLARNFNVRGRLDPLHSLAEWRVFFHSALVVRWTVRWWRFYSMLYVDPNVPHARLLGVTSVTFIFRFAY